MFGEHGEGQRQGTGPLPYIGASSGVLPAPPPSSTILSESSPAYGVTVTVSDFLFLP